MLANVIKALFRSNRKSYFLMLIAFTITSICITQIFVVTESNIYEIRRYIYEESSSTGSISCSVQLSLFDYFTENNNSFLNYPIPSDFANAIMEEVEKSPLKDKLTACSVNFISGIFSVKINDNFYQYSTINIHVIPDNIFQYLTPYSYWQSTIPYVDYAILLIDSNSLLPSSYSFPYYALLDQENITLALIEFELDNEVFYSTPITINFSHKILYETEEDTEFGKILNSYLFRKSDSGLILSETFYKMILESIFATNPNFQDFKTFANAKVIPDTSKLDYTEEELYQMIALKDEIKTNLLQKLPIITELKMMGISASSYEAFKIEFAEYQVILALLTLPIVFLTGIFIYYGNEQFSLQSENFSEYFSIHGISRKVLFFSELICILIIALLGFLIGLALSVPIVLLVNNGVWLFGNSQPTKSTIISSTSLLKSTFLYFGVFILINIPSLLFRTFQISKPKQIEVDSKRKKIQLLGYFILDLALIALLLIFIYVRIHWPSYATYLIASFSSVLLLVGGVILTIYQFLPLLIDDFSKKLWQKHTSLFNFSLLNLSANKKMIRNVLVMFTASFSVIILATSLSFGIIASKSNDAKFAIGADARVDVISDADISILSQSLPSSISFTEVFKLDYIYDTTNRHVLSFYIIDPLPFSQIAYYSKSDTGLNLRKAISILEGTNSCLVGSTRAQDFSLSISEDYLFRLSGENETISHQLCIEGMVETWPFFIEKENPLIIIEGIDLNKPLRFIVSFSTGQFLLNSSLDFIINRYILFDLSDSTNDILTLQSLVQELDIVYNLETFDEEFQYALNKPMVKLTINFSFFFGIVALIIVICSLIFYIQRIFIQRKREINIYLSLGAINKQLLLLLFFEVIFVLIISSILGLLLGLFLLFLQPVVINPYFVGIFSPSPLIMFLIIFSTIVGVYGISALLIPSSISWNLKKKVNSMQARGEK